MFFFCLYFGIHLLGLMLLNTSHLSSLFCNGGFYIVPYPGEDKKPTGDCTCAAGETLNGDPSTCLKDLISTRLSLFYVDKV